MPRFPMIKLDDQPLTRRIFKPMEFVPCIHGRPRVSEYCRTNSAIVTHVSEFYLAEIEAWDEVKQPPKLVFGHPEAADNMEDACSRFIAGRLC